MASPKILVAFYSSFGTNHQMAAAAADAAREAGAEVRLRRFPETAPDAAINSVDAWKEEHARQQDIEVISTDDMEWAQGYFFSVPTRYGSQASQARSFIDTLGPLWGEGKLANKTFTATSSAQNTHGGQEMTVQSLNTTAMHWGCYIITPGYADPVKFEDGGNPYGYTTRGGEFDDTGRRSVSYQAKRLVDATAKLVG